MDDLLADFIAETREMLAASEGEIIAWEADPGDRARLDTIFRFVHTVKGNCGFFDFPQLEKLSHAAEDALADVRAGRRSPDAALVTAVLAIIDRITELVDLIEAGEPLPENGDEALIAALEENASDEFALAAGALTSNTDPSGVRKTEPGSTAARTIRLPVELLDRVMSGVSDMVLARNDLGHRLRQAGGQPTIDGPFERLSAILNDVRDAVTRMRMHPIDHLFSAFPRLVRDLSAELGKQVLIEIESGDVELDREMIEMIRDPMTHIVRNAIDHGIEPPSDRLKAGKHEIGVLRIGARQAGNNITIVVNDDGAGLDEEKIAEKAVANGLITSTARAAMSREEILQLIFEPGLSTSEKVSSVSGRGVGLDVVRSNLERVGGTIRVASTPGQGTFFLLQVPLTLSIISALTVEVAGQRFAIPQSYVEEIIHLSSSNVKLDRVGDALLVEFRGHRTPCVSLAGDLGLENQSAENDRSAVVIKLGNGQIFALVVDRIGMITELVVKPLPQAILATELYTGTTLLDDGLPMLVLDIGSIARRAGVVTTDLRAFSAKTKNKQSEATGKAVLHVMVFKDFSLRRRAVRLELVRRIETIDADAIDWGGDLPRAAIDGEIVTLVGLADGEVPEGKVRLLRLFDGSCDVLYAVSEVLDAATLDQDLVEVDGDGLIEAVTLLDGSPIELIDGHRLFAQYGTTPRTVASLTCRLPDDDWSNRILAPLIASAGYRVITDAETHADVAILLEESDRTTQGDESVIRLRNNPDDAVSEQDRQRSIYRYDRDRLLNALRAVRQGEAA